MPAGATKTRMDGSSTRFHMTSKSMIYITYSTSNLRRLAFFAVPLWRHILPNCLLTSTNLVRHYYHFSNSVPLTSSTNAISFAHVYNPRKIYTLPQTTLKKTTLAQPATATSIQHHFHRLWHSFHAFHHKTTTCQLDSIHFPFQPSPQLNQYTLRDFRNVISFLSQILFRQTRYREDNYICPSLATILVEEWPLCKVL